MIDTVPPNSHTVFRGVFHTPRQASSLVKPHDEEAGSCYRPLSSASLFVRSLSASTEVAGAFCAGAAAAFGSPNDTSSPCSSCVHPQHVETAVLNERTHDSHNLTVLCGGYARDRTKLRNRQQGVCIATPAEQPVSSVTCTPLRTATCCMSRLTSSSGVDSAVWLVIALSTNSVCTSSDSNWCSNVSIVCRPYVMGKSAGGLFRQVLIETIPSLNGGPDL